MDDLFDREQTIYDNAVKYANEIKNGTPCGGEEFINIVKEYGRLLRQLRRITKLTDRTTIDLNTSKLALIDKVHYDGLTGIYNRRFMEENLQWIIKTLSRSPHGTLSLLMVDIDHFKEYNDTYGHSAGDDCLRAVASAINRCIMRKDDFVARYGGEEFTVILPNTEEEGAHYMAKKLLDNIMELNIKHESSKVAPCVTVSIGITTGKAEFNHTSVDYVKRADEALYMSKQNGRNRYTFVSFT